MIARGAVRKAVNQAVRQAYSDMALLAVRPCEPAYARERAAGQVLWSWVEITEPSRGVLAVVQPMELAQEVTRTVLGMESGEPLLTEMIDAQCEFTNIIAGRALNQVIGPDQVLKLAAPMSGKGAPNVRQGDWLGQTFAAGKWWLAVFLQCPAVLEALDVELPAGAVAASDPETLGLRPSESASASGRVPVSAALEAKPPGARPVPSGRMGAVPPGRSAPPAPPTATPPASRPPTASPGAAPPRAASPPPPAAPPAAAPSRPASSISSRRGVVRTIHGLRPSSGEVPIPGAAAAPIDPAQTLPWHRVPKTASETFSVPERIGHYQVLGRLGEGGMGVVLKAKHATLDRLVALKVMKPSLAKDPAYVERFMREARIAASLEHPNLVTVYDAAYEDGFLYMALRHVDGGDLGEALQRDGALDQARAITVFTGCARALEVIAAKGLVHRDIKPGNILLDRDGTPRLADFGLARAQAGAAADTAAAGTPAFMSPEQLDGTGDLDVRSDIYSLGVTMFVALTCQQPFQGADVVATIANVLKAEAPDARACNPAVSQAMAQLVAKAMRKDRAQRHQSATEFLDQLQGVQDESRNEISASGVTWFGKLFGPKPGKG